MALEVTLFNPPEVINTKGRDPLQVAHMMFPIILRRYNTPDKKLEANDEDYIYPPSCNDTDYPSIIHIISVDDKGRGDIAKVLLDLISESEFIEGGEVQPVLRVPLDEDHEFQPIYITCDLHSILLLGVAKYSADYS